ncbi:MAG: diguanylate cyclase, partial [Deltaproteobacteria bacterium]|nr:diguanylate cyclase [Deltaproteobacteria bacterium]
MRADPTQERRLVLIDPDERSRRLLVTRLISLGFTVDVAPDAVAGAELALASPPSAVIADLWMRGVSGLQLCRLLRAEPGTADVPVVLRVPVEDPRSRFWAEQAGAAGLVSKGRMGDLARLLASVASTGPAGSGFFTHLAGDSIEIRDRIAHHLDAALFESVIAGEVRRLGTVVSFEKLFDAFSQLAARLMTYRWLAIATESPKRFAIHANPRAVAAAEVEARSVLDIDARTKAVLIVDEDADDEARENEKVSTSVITFGESRIGKIAVAMPPPPLDHGVSDLVGLVGRELGGPIRMTTLVEQANRLATTDPLTDLLNRRAFGEVIAAELARADRFGGVVSTLLLDIDHFKSIN